MGVPPISLAHKRKKARPSPFGGTGRCALVVIPIFLGPIVAVLTPITVVVIVVFFTLSPITLVVIVVPLLLAMPLLFWVPVVPILVGIALPHPEGEIAGPHPCVAPVTPPPAPIRAWRFMPLPVTGLGRGRSDGTNSYGCDAERDKRAG